MLIAGATTAVVKPELVPVAVIGSTAPDWMETVGNFFGMRIKHRTVTHYVVVWLIALIGSAALDPTGWVTAFCYGGLSHVLTDAMTVTGVPFSPASDRRFHLFGGRFRTGDPVEYVISGGIVVVCSAFVIALGASGWYPFLWDWAGYYNDGMLDASEWRQNRFKIL